MQEVNMFKSNNLQPLVLSVGSLALEIRLSVSIGFSFWLRKFMYFFVNFVFFNKSPSDFYFRQFLQKYISTGSGFLSYFPLKTVYCAFKAAPHATKVRRRVASTTVTWTLDTVALPVVDKRFAESM